MAYIPKSNVKVFYNLIKEGWEPTLREIKEKFFSNYSKLEQEKLTRSLISRVRRWLKKEDLYFYNVTFDKIDDNTIEIKRKFKLLASSGEYFDITHNLWNITNGFINSCGQVVGSGLKNFPKSLQPLLLEFKVGLNMIASISQNMVKNLDSSIKEKENENSHK